MPVTDYYSVNGEIIGEHTVGQSRLDYVTDGLRSVIANVDQTLTVKSTGRYKPSGADLATTGTQPAFGFTGSAGSRRTGLPHSDLYRLRHLGSTEGRRTTPDPVWPFEPPYTYAGANPTTYTDPTGLSPACDVPPGATGPIPMFPASPCAMSGDPCAYAQSQGADSGDWGGVICCDGRKYTCAWNIPPGSPPGLTICTKVHEHTHESQVSCPSTGFARPPFNSGENVSKDECAAYVADSQCLIKYQKIDCNKLTGVARQSCLSAYHADLCSNCAAMQHKYHCPSSQIPSFCKYCP
jgi:RHS repeat-associated protein